MSITHEVLSTTSVSTLDSTSGCESSSGDYSKLKNQIISLKASLLDEKAKNEDQQHALNAAEAKLRKVTGENESLTFRNAQLVKRVEALQTTLDNNNAAFLMAKNKKKHKEANLRLFGESSRQQAFHPVDPALVMEQELERKLAENSELHSKIFDMEKQQEFLAKELTTRIDQLEKENIRLKKLIEVRGVCAPRESSHDSQPSSSNGMENESLRACTQSSLPDVDDNLTDTSTMHYLNFDENHLMDSHFFEKVENLTASLRHATGRAEYYKQECECLVRKSIIELEAKKAIEKQLEELEEKCALLNESLETTRQNYESQMRGLYEHMAEQDARIVEQSERLSGIAIEADIQNNNGHDQDCNSAEDNRDGSNSRKSSMRRENKSSIGKNLRRIVGK